MMLSVVVLLLLLVVFIVLGRMMAKNEELTKRVAALEQKLARPAPSGSEKAAIPPSPLLVRKQPPMPGDREVLPSRPAAPPPLAVKAPFNWEAFMGVKLFAWLGGFALFLGVVFLVKYSFENNLISPLGRIAIGAGVGAALVAFGWWLARGRYRTTTQSLCATGVVILYADLFAAHSFYGLISLTTAFFAMSAVTLCSFLLAVSLSAQVIVILGLLGGFLTPVFLRSGVDNAPALFLYIALLDLGVAAVSLRKRWLYLVALAAVGTVFIQLGWAAEFFNVSKGGRAFWIFLGFQALFLAVGFGEPFCSRFAVRSAGFRISRSSLRDITQPLASHSEAATEWLNWLVVAAGVTGFVALAFGFWLSAYPLLARQPLFFFGFVFLADAGLLALPVLGWAPRGIALGAGLLAFALVAEWIVLFAPQTPLIASLAAIILFALLHAATIPAEAWRPTLLPLTAAGAITPFALLVLLFERVEIWNPTPIFALALLLALILLGAAIVRRADWLALAALIGTGLVELAWQTDRFTEAQAFPTLVCYGLFLLLFVAYPFCSAEKEKAWPWAISALAQALQFWLFYQAISRAFPNDWMGVLPATFIVPAGTGLWALLQLYRAEPASGDPRLAWQGGALLLFVSLIFPLQFDREWITLGWALEGLALLWLFGRVPHRGLRVVALVLLAAAFARLALNPAVFEYHKRSPVRIFNWYLYAYGVTSVCLLAGAQLFGHPRPTAAERSAPAFLGSLGGILVFLLLNLEIADYFSVGPTLTFSFSGNFARDMTYSIAWAIFALGLILVGMRMRQRAARYAGLGLLGVTLTKLFLHDLNDLDELYRIGAFVGVAIILIMASFIYQRFLAPEGA